MRINCINGFFVIEEGRVGEASEFSSYFGPELARFRDKFTFAPLINPPEYSIQGSTYMEAPATKNFAGDPWDIFKENGLVYNVLTGKVVLIDSIIQTFEISQAGNYFVANGLIQPGSKTKDGNRVVGYHAYFGFDKLKFRYSEVTYD